MASVGSKLPVVAKGLLESAKPKLSVFMKYARVELAPPRMSEMREVMAGFGRLSRSFKTGAWKNLTVREGWLNTLIGMEVVFCFYIGECLGKGSLIGYHV